MDLQQAKAQAAAEVERRRPELVELSRRIHANPELGFEEKQAAAALTEFLEANGFGVQRGFCELATAFKASYGRGRPAIAFLAEYDALPKLGHACGHNIIACSAVGAALATKSAMSGVGGSILVIGTPAEELYGGKAIMVNRGGFDGISAALLVHPFVRDMAAVEALACRGLEVEFFGRAAHAAARPEEGINALEALILSFNGINSLRQHIRSDARIHGIITHGGDAANVVPDHAAGSFLVRAADEVYLNELGRKVLSCFQAAAMATGAKLQHKWAEVSYAPFRINNALAELYTANMGALGRKLRSPRLGVMLGSVDMGNVSMVVPSLHAMVAIAPKDILLHTPEFAEAAISPAGHQGLVDGAKALAMTALDLLMNPEALAKVEEEFLSYSVAGARVHG